MMNRRIKVLFLPRWFPNRYDPMPGLFIQRQAEALTGDCDVAVIYLHPDPHCREKSQVEFAEENQVRVIRIYYRVPENSTNGFSRFLNLWKYYKHGMKAIRSIRAFEPDLIHAHILTRPGVLALRAAGIFGCPYIISEHWSRYFPSNNTYSGTVRHMVTRHIIGKAAAVAAVSGTLKAAMEQWGLTHADFRVIPNVVDTLKFFPPEKSSRQEIKTFIHVSCFDDRAKNISGFLRAVKALSDIRSDFRCILAGEGPDWHDMKDYAGYLRIPDDRITFSGLMAGDRLTELYQQAAFSVLSSRYETFGTVIVESLACGTPVLSTAVGIAPELIKEMNGMIVPGDDDGAMIEALGRMLDKSAQFDRAAIAQNLASRFDPDTVGTMILDMYRDILGKH